MGQIKARQLNRMSEDVRNASVVRWHGGKVVCIVSLQQKDPSSSSFCVEFSYSPCVYSGSFQTLQHPLEVQGHVG